MTSELEPTHWASVDTSAESKRLTNDYELSHVLFADYLCVLFTGYRFHEFKGQAPKDNSLAYKSLQREKALSKFFYGMPQQQKVGSERGLMTHFFNFPLIYLLTGPKKADSAGHVGLEYFTSRGVTPTLMLLNELFAPYNMVFVNNIFRNKEDNSLEGHLTLHFNKTKHLADVAAYKAKH